VGAAAATRPPAANPVPSSAAQSVPAPPAPPLDFALVDEAARTLPRLHSLIVSRRGDVLFERYYNGRTRERAANIKSASKSIISALVGIAIGRGIIPDVNTPIVTWFPELARDPDPRKRDITVEHLLTMRPGLEGTSNRNYGAWVTSRNWVRHALARPMFAAPGVEMEYSTGNTHLLSAILTQASARSTWQFANDVLAKPLGFTLPQWPRDPQGIYFGGNDMLMTPRQMLAFGEAYLDDGLVNGQQVIPERWIEQSCEGRARNRRPGNPAFNADGFVDPMRDREYGYGWWVHEIGGVDACFAWGYGGQYIFVLLVFDILERLIIAPMRDS
jgi:CubicO group peptidase (beta-lactamase class C family)